MLECWASGTQLIQELIAEGLHAVARYQPQSDKVMRMHAQTAMIENGFVHVPDAAPWLAQYLHELTSFPNGRHDDQVDSTAQMLDWFKRGAGPSSNAGIFELYRQRAQELRRAQAPRPHVCLRAPPGIGQVPLLSGIRRTVAADDTVEMTEADAAPLLRAGWVRVDPDGPAGTAEEARGLQAPRERRVRLRVSPGIGHRNMLLLNVAADGTAEMLESEAESFLRAGWVRVDAGDVWARNKGPSRLGRARS